MAAALPRKARREMAWPCGWLMCRLVLILMNELRDVAITSQHHFQVVECVNYLRMDKQIRELFLAARPKVAKLADNSSKQITCTFASYNLLSAPFFSALSS